MRLSFLFGLVVAGGFCAVSTAVAEIKTCTFEKQILRSHETDTNETCTNFFGESFKIDTAKNALYVQWPRGASGWFAPDKITKNRNFTSYILYRNLKIGTLDKNSTAKTRLCTITYRLYADGKRAEAHQNIPQHVPRAARYSCK